MTALPTPTPTPSPETKAFWDATAEGRLLLPKCTSCGTVIWYPRGICPDCHSTEVEWFEAAGTGSVYTWTVTHRGEGPYREAAPYCIAYVELDEGPRILTNIVDVDVSAIAIGQRVTLAWADTGEGTQLPRFRPL